MQWRKSVVIDSLQGQALIGTTVVPVADAGQRGALQVGGAAGAIVRPLAFGERTRIAARAMVTAHPVDALCAGIAAAAALQPGDTDPVVQEILALALAGADQDAPLYAETALLVIRATGWEFAQLEEADAVTVDRLAVYLAGRPPEDEPGWNRIVLVDDGGSLEGIRREMAERLLKRAVLVPQDVQAATLFSPAPLDNAGLTRPEVLRPPSGGNAAEYPGPAAESAPAASNSAKSGWKMAHDGQALQSGFIRLRGGENSAGRTGTSPAAGEPASRLKAALRPFSAPAGQPPGRSSRPLRPAGAVSSLPDAAGPVVSPAAAPLEPLPILAEPDSVPGEWGAAFGYSSHSQSPMGQAAALDLLLPGGATALNSDALLLGTAEALAALLAEEADLRGITR